MMNRIIRISLAIIGLGFGFVANAVADVASAAIDTPWVAVGMPRVLHIEVSVPDGAQVQWPMEIEADGFVARDFEDPSKNYLLEFGPDTDFSIDTVREAGGMVSLKADLKFFAFDSAAMVIAPFRFVVNGRDTLATQMLALKCENPFESVPDDVQATQDLKPVMQPAFVLWDYVWWFFWLQVVVTIITVSTLVYLHWRKHRTLKVADGASAAPVKLLPAHVTALRALDTLAEKKLWQSGQHKQFHTELSEILRRYIEERYKVPAMECTTDEIMQELVELTMTQRSSYNNLREVLQMADLVKFAKYEPLADENQMVLMNARLFVEQTKESLPEETTENKDEGEPQQ